MPLDNFDQRALDMKGDPSDVIFKLYKRKINLNNAKKYRAGINMHLNCKASALPVDNTDTNMKREEITTDEDGTKTAKRILMLSEEDKKNPARVMTLMGFDPIQWTLIRLRIKFADWNVTIKNVDKEGVKHTNYAHSVELTAKPLQNKIASDVIKQVFENLEPPKLDEIKYKAGNLMLEFPILDFHLGSIAWAEETGEDYDLKIAVKLYKDTVLDILSRVKAYGLQIDRIIFPVGQDFYHVDTTTSTTTKGTIVHADLRWQKIYSEGVDLLIWAVEQLRQIAPVEIVYVPGNHDKATSYYATVTLDKFYDKLKSVQVDALPTPRKYIQYGKCLIGYAHGKEEGKRIEHLMQTEMPEAWGETCFREWHLGHVHHETAKEVGGAIIRTLSSIAATDVWHKEKGFIGAIRKAEAYVWDRERGRRLVIDSCVTI